MGKGWSTLNRECSTLLSDRLFPRGREKTN